MDPLVPQANPKAFFGYSDNTNLLVYLWNLGIIGFYRGSTMVHLARPGRLHPMTLESMPGAEYVYRVLLGMGETRHARGVRCGGGGAYQQFSVWTSATLTRTS